MTHATYTERMEARRANMPDRRRAEITALFGELDAIAEREIDTLARVATLADSQPGDHHAERARVLDIGRPATDLSDERYQVPAWHTATVSDRTARRSNSGRTSVKITRRGHVRIVGDRYPNLNERTDGSPIPASVIADACERATNGPWANVDMLAAIATHAYGLPELIGTDRASWAEALDAAEDREHADVLAAMSRHTCGLTGYYGDPHPADVVSPMHHAIGRTGWITYRRGTQTHPIRPMPARHRAATVRPRKAERDRWHEHRDADGNLRYRYVVTDGVIRVISTADDPDYVFVGHERVARPERATRAARTVRSDRADRARPIPTGVTLSDGVAAIAADMRPGARVTYRYRGAVGTVTSGQTGRLSATLPDGRRIKSARSVLALRNGIRRLTD